MIIIAAECRILQDFWQDFEEEMNTLAPLVRQEAGCSRYEPLTSTEEPGLFIILEEWESRKHLDDHLSTSHMKKHAKQSKSWLSKPVSLSIYETTAKEQITL